jgi:6-pyruvoyl-tetrahydropterin synthase
MRRILFIFLLNPEENPRDYFQMLEELEGSLINELDASYLPDLLKNFYLEKTSGEILTEFNADQLSTKLINRSKELLDAGEIQKAQILISRAKSYPQQIAEALQSAEAALNEKKYVIAGTYYETASNLLLEIDETTLMQQYAEKAEKLKKIPTLQKERKEYIENAIKALKKVDFSEAIEWFNAAAKNSEELEDEVKLNEYTIKAKALNTFLDAEREAHLQETSENEE